MPLMQSEDLLEGAMLVLSLNWCWSIAEMLPTCAVVGRSARFVLLICAGRVRGVTAKLPARGAAGTPSPLVWLCARNLGVTLLDLALVLRFSSQPARVRARARRRPPGAPPRLSAPARAGRRRPRLLELTA